ncbi:hypothetical protein [Paenibacillus odorifer]|uniref:hypothetical protein n=1 Tax=Paenibacillus odorifer TaxID=189426 RepID=UPI0019551E1A|nr:hypothetical protein [Paenibacillus odorifer]
MEQNRTEQNRTEQNRTTAHSRCLGNCGVGCFYRDIVINVAGVWWIRVEWNKAEVLREKATEERQNGRTAELQNGRTEEWENGRTEEQLNIMQQGKISMIQLFGAFGYPARHTQLKHLCTNVLMPL